MGAGACRSCGARPRPWGAGVPKKRWKNSSGEPEASDASPRFSTRMVTTAGEALSTASA